MHAPKILIKLHKINEKVIKVIKKLRKRSCVYVKRELKIFS